MVFFNKRESEMNKMYKIFSVSVSDLYTSFCEVLLSHNLMKKQRRYKMNELTRLLPRNKFDFKRVHRIRTMSREEIIPLYLVLWNGCKI